MSDKSEYVNYGQLLPLITMAVTKQMVMAGAKGVGGGWSYPRFTRLVEPVEIF